LTRGPSFLALLLNSAIRQSLPERAPAAPSTQSIDLIEALRIVAPSTQSIDLIEALRIVRTPRSSRVRFRGRSNEKAPPVSRQSARDAEHS